MKGRVLAYAAILAAGAALRFVDLGRESFWHDEAWSWWLATHSGSDLVQTLREADGHPPLYYLLLSGWMQVGDSEAWLRSLSVLFGLLTLPLVARLGDRLGGRAAGYVAMAFLALCPAHVWFSRETRSYSLLVFETALLLALLVELRAGRSKRWWIAVAFVVAAILYTHYMGGLLVVAAVAMALLWSRPAADFSGPALAAFGGGAVLFSPWIPAAWDHLFRVGGGFWISSPTLNGVARSLAELTVAPVETRWPILAWVVWALAVAAPWVAKDRELRTWFLPIFLPVGLLLGVSFWRPMYYARTLLTIVVPVAALSAVTVARLPKRASWIAGAALLAAFIPGLVAIYSGKHKEDWRGGAEFVQNHLKPGEVVAVYPAYLDRGLQYYWRKGGPGPIWTADTGPLSWSVDREREKQAFTDLVERVKKASPAGVWIVRRPVEFLLHPPELEKIDALLPRRFYYLRNNVEVIGWVR